MDVHVVYKTHNRTAHPPAMHPLGARRRRIAFPVRFKCTATALDYYVYIYVLLLYCILYIHPRLFFFVLAALLCTVCMYCWAVGLHIDDEPVAITFVSVPKTMGRASEPRRRPAAYYIRVNVLCLCDAYTTAAGRI